MQPVPRPVLVWAPESAPLEPPSHLRPRGRIIGRAGVGILWRESLHSAGQSLTSLPPLTRPRPSPGTTLSRHRPGDPSRARLSSLSDASMHQEPSRARARPTCSHRPARSPREIAPRDRPARSNQRGSRGRRLGARARWCMHRADHAAITSRSRSIDLLLTNDAMSYEPKEVSRSPNGLACMNRGSVSRASSA